MTRPSILRSLSPLLLLLFSLFNTVGAQAQDLESKTQTRREFTLAGGVGNGTLALYNLFGSVRVQGYAGRQVVVEITKTITAPDARTLAAGQQQAQPGFAQHGDSLTVYLAAPYDSRPRRRDDGRNRPGRDEEKDIAYGYRFDFVVKVPYAMAVHASTVNNGAVEVQDVSGPLRVFNVNGAIRLTNARGTTEARTVNGNVEATYAAAPPGASSYHTINGQIRVRYPASLAADLHFKSMHGELFTDFPNAEILPAQVTKNRENQGDGTVYRLSKDTAVRLGRGGPALRFETLNGDVTITKQ